MTSTVSPTSSTVHSTALPPRSWRIPTVLAVLAVATFVAFGLFGEDRAVTFGWSSPGDTFVLDPTSASPRLIGWALGIVALVAAATAILLTARRRPLPVWLPVIVGLAFLISIVAWVGAGGLIPVTLLLSGSIALSTAIVLGALAGVIGERVGIVNIAIEGQLLGGAFVAAVVATTTENYLLALIAAMVVGALISMVLAAFSIVYLVDQVVVGVVLIALVTAVTNFFHSAVLGPNTEQYNSPGTMPRFAVPGLSDIPVIGSALFEQRPTTYLMFLLVPAVWFALFKTRWGLRVRSLGEHPLAADTVGINVNRTRFWTLTVAGLIAGIGGAALTIGGVGGFVREMSAGQGFIALAAVILGRWNPWYAALAALLFGFSTQFRIVATQAGATIPPDLIAMTPYVVTILAVALVAGRVIGPRASGKPYLKE